MSEQTTNLKRQCDKIKDANDELEDNFKNKKICVSSLDIVCPITKEIFCIPVTSNDGFTYEKFAIDKILAETRVSPMTRESLTSYCENKIMRRVVKEFLEINPEYKSLQFKNDDYYDYTANKAHAIRLLVHKNFMEFSKYRNIVLSDHYSDYHRDLVMDTVIYHCTDDDLLIKIIDNSIDYGVAMCLIIELCSKKIILHMIDKGADIYNLGPNKDSIIHLLQQRTNLNDADKKEIIMYILNKNMLVFSYHNKNGVCIIDLLISNFNFCDEIMIHNTKRLHAKSSFVINNIYLIRILRKCKSEVIEPYINLLENFATKENVASSYVGKIHNIECSLNSELTEYMKCLADNNNLSNQDKKGYTNRIYNVYKNKLDIDDLDRQNASMVLGNILIDQTAKITEFRKNIEEKMNAETLSESAENLLKQVV